MSLLSLNIHYFWASSPQVLWPSSGVLKIMFRRRRENITHNKKWKFTTKKPIVKYCQTICNEFDERGVWVHNRDKKSEKHNSLNVRETVKLTKFKALNVVIKLHSILTALVKGFCCCKTYTFSLNICFRIISRRC